MHSKLIWICLAVAAVAVVSRGKPTPVIIQVDAAHPGAPMNPGMFGIFFEDINFGADGGLYPELIKNRSFEFAEPLAGWKAILNVQDGTLAAPKGEMDLRTEDPLNANNPHYLRLKADEPGFGISNAGYRGMGVVAGNEYRFSAYVRSADSVLLRATLSDDRGNEIGTGTLRGFQSEWKQYETVIRPSATASHAQFRLFLDTKGTVDLDMISLYPVDTWKGRRNGLRKDLVQLLHDMHPGFVRFPGGCIVEGRRLATRYRWKNTVGDIAERKTIVNRWNDEFDSHPTPDYFQSFGLGFYEFFQLAEDIGAKPLPILNCGMACEFNSGELAPLDQTQEYIQDALDLIEFANGAPTSPWGKLRVSMGHPATFGLAMIGVGNEQWGPHYLERYKLFAAGVKAKYPEIKLVASAGPSPAGSQFEYLWQNWRALHADIVDEHYYMSPGWFLQNSGRYDHYDRTGPKVFAGEFAAQTAGTTRADNRNNWKGALAEAAFMTGLERNGDVVRMASYAPLLANVDAWQWTPDAIWFDSLRSYGTPNYLVQQIFSKNAGTRIVPVSPAVRDEIYASASLDERSHELIVTVVNASGGERPAEVRLGDASMKAAVRATTLAASPDAENSFDSPKKIAPEASTAEVDKGVLAAILKPYSVVAYRVQLAR